jgi:transposase-like protein
MTKKIKFSEEEEKEIISLYLDKKISSGKIAKLFGCCDSVILNFFKEKNVQLFPLGFFIRGNGVIRKKLDDEEIKRLYLEERKSTQKIAEIMNCSNVLISNHLKKINVLMRTPSERTTGIKQKPFTEEQRKARSERVTNDYIIHPELRELRGKQSKERIRIAKENGTYEDIRKRSSETRIRKIQSGEITVWNVGLTKETSDGMRRISESKIGVKKPELTKRNLENNPMNNPETRKKSGKGVREQWKDPNSKYNSKEFRENQSKTLIERMMKRPTSFEQKISDLCMKYHLPFVYTGDGRMLINFKNPDFVCEEKKIVIEVFLNYFKIRDYGSIENYMKIRGEHFAKQGYKTIFIQEEEIKDKNWEEICLNKIKKLL